MKLQHLAVIFIIIILPISITISNYLQSQIDEITMQNSYDAKLQDATYDMVKAFQLNTVNNKFSTISDSKIRDIEAAVNTFYNTLGANLGASGYDKNTLRNYTPALLFNLYDGYYIYSTYDNAGDGKAQHSNASGGTIGTGLKPFIYYSARYVKNPDTDIVVNYTLDNYVTIMGKVHGNLITKSGYLIDPNEVNIAGNISAYLYDGSNINDYTVSLTSGGSINNETLTEFLVVLDDNGNVDYGRSKDYNYLQLNSQKIYWDSADPGKYYYYNKYQLAQISDASTITQIEETGGQSASAKKYWIEAKIFSDWVDANLDDVQISNLKNEKDYSDANYWQTLAYQPINGGNTNIFNLGANNNPMRSDAPFNEHRRAIIRKSIEDNLSVVMTNFSNDNGINNYEYMMPVLSDVDWGKIVDNISVLTFLQGIPMKYKFYNNYCVVTNNKNQEVVENNSIYIIDNDNGTYHKPGCTELFGRNSSNLQGYINIDFLRQTAKQSEASTPYYFYPKANSGTGVNNPSNSINGTSRTACYNCIVNAKQTYSTDDIIAGAVQDVNGNTINSSNTQFTKIRTAYLIALARCRYDLYKISGYFNAN